MNLIQKLEEFGLSNREAEVYLALLQKKEFTAPELTRITTITRTKIYEHLQNLVNKGLCSESTKNGQKIFKAVKPKIVLADILRNYEKELAEKRNSSFKLEKELTSIHEMGLTNADSIDYIEVLNDAPQIRERWIKIEKSLQKEMLVFSKPPFSMSLEENINEGSKVLKRKNVKVKCIYEYDGLTTEEVDNLLKIVGVYQKLGEEAKIIKKLPMKLAVCDESVTMLALNDKIPLNPGFTTLIIDHAGFASALKNTFETYWSQAMTIKEFKKSISQSHYLKD